MLNPIEISLETARKINLENFVVEQKYDGSRHLWIHDRLLSEREVDKTNFFPQITKQLENIDGILDMEVYIENGNIFDLNRKINRTKAKAVVFDIIELNGENFQDKTLEERQKILQNIIKNRIVHLPLKFEIYENAFGQFEDIWNFVKENNFEGLVLKRKDSLYRTKKDLLQKEEVKNWLKIKNFKEAVEEIIFHEEGTQKGAFILKNGSRTSALSPFIVNQYRALKQMYGKVFLEFEYLFRTEDNKYFQPRPKRFIVEGKKVEFV